MKIIFNDSTELVIQSAAVQSDESLLIKTVAATEDELKAIFQDGLKTKKMTIEERGATVATYEKYTALDAIVKYTAGILGVVLFKAGETADEKLDSLTETTAELSATMDSLLTEVIPLLMG